LRASKIREVANAGLDVPGVLPFWFGESDQVTPQFIRDAAVAALNDGATFYTSNFGTPALREALSDYVGVLHGATPPANIAVTSAGVSALMLVTQLIVGAGDRVVALTPLWPNLVEMPKILGADVHTVALHYGAVGQPAGGEGWSLDLAELLAALTPDTRMLFLNSPNNPTGWVMTRAEQEAVLTHCRRLGIWIVADEVYERLHFGTDAAAPSFLDLAGREERVICINSFSKTWLMTGWRLGWMVAPSGLMEDLGKLIEYNTSCAPDFVQRAGVAALREGTGFAAGVAARMRAARDHLVAALRTIPGIDVAPPGGAMYLFFRLPGATDSLALCKQLVREARLGLAPGVAFGPEGEGFVRWCYACEPALLDDGVERLRRFLAEHPSR
jgi:aspartate/methionine/tyrosine aminotransferase